jgi:hypothetical protein
MAFEAIDSLGSIGRGKYGETDYLKTGTTSFIDGIFPRDRFSCAERSSVSERTDEAADMVRRAGLQFSDLSLSEQSIFQK